jgi:hypothetical protein
MIRKFVLTGAAAALLAAGAARAAEDGEGPRPGFEFGDTWVQASSGGKLLWKAKLRFPVGGVLVNPRFWTIFSKDAARARCAALKALESTFSKQKTNPMSILRGRPALGVDGG